MVVYTTFVVMKNKEGIDLGGSMVKIGLGKYSRVKVCGLSVRDISEEFNFKNVNSFRHSSKFGVYMGAVDRILGIGIEVGRDMAKREIVEGLSSK